MRECCQTISTLPERGRRGGVISRHITFKKWLLHCQIAARTCAVCVTAHADVPAYMVCESYTGPQIECPPRQPSLQMTTMKYFEYEVTLSCGGIIFNNTMQCT